MLATTASAATRLLRTAADSAAAAAAADELEATVRAVPLMRVYATWPADGPAPWWRGMAKTVVGGASKLGMFIPIDDRVAMASYTDGALADEWNDAEKSGEIEELLWRELRRAFPRQTARVGDAGRPERVYAHYWPEGVHCFAPRADGASDAALARRWVEPVPRLHLVGEAFSAQHQWMESALQSAGSVAARALA